MTKQIIIDVTKNEATTNGQTCNLVEAGLCPSGGLDSLMDRDEIEEYLEEQGYKVEFEYSESMTRQEFDAHFGCDPFVDLPHLNISEDAYYTIEGSIAAVNVGSQRFGTFEV